MNLKTAEICLLIFHIWFVQGIHSSWWYLGMAGSASHSLRSSSSANTPLHSRCSQINVLAPHQQLICSKSRSVIEVVTAGASVGIEECQHQFREHRWNCTTFNTTNVFGNILNVRSREKAYIYAVSSAGVTYAVTKACARGEMNICGCDTTVRARETRGTFTWGGCSHNVAFGERFAGEFLDEHENDLAADGLMNLWNNKAGRRSLMTQMQLVCKCHGVSGSCSMKICWRVMPSFREVGRDLKTRFDGASHVMYLQQRHRLKPYDAKQKKPTKRDLVYLEESPDFCEYNPNTGSLGTKGRECNKSSYGLDGCALMCCGRGYQTIIKETKEDCDCKFFWCCHVECRKCTRTVEKHYCK